MKNGTQEARCPAVDHQLNGHLHVAANGGHKDPQKETPSPLPHGVQQGAILGDPQELVGHGHVVCHRLLAIVKEGIWSPDLTCH